MNISIDLLIQLINAGADLIVKLKQIFATGQTEMTIDELRALLASVTPPDEPVPEEPPNG